RNPRYEGFNKDGSRYVVTAETAKADFQSKGPIALNAITGKLFEANDAVTTVRATRGTYTRESGRLDLSDGIEIESTTGLKAALATAKVDAKAGVVTSDQTVEVTLPGGKVVGRTMRLDQKTETIVFDNGVRARLTPEAASKAGASPATPANGSGGIGLGRQQSGPIVITSKSLQVAGRDNQATFLTNVRAEQGQAVLTAREMAASFERSSKAGASTPATAAAPTGGSLESVTARGDVKIAQPGMTAAAPAARFNVAANTVELSGGVEIARDGAVTKAETVTLDTTAERALLTGGVTITSGDDRSAVANRAELDQKARTARLLGGVKVRQGRNLLVGEDLFIDEAGGRLALSNPARGGTISARFFRANAKGQRAGSAADATGPAAAGWTFRTDANAPVDITAERLDVDDGAKTATFRRAVRVVQGSIIMNAPSLVARYTGSAGALNASSGVSSGAQPSSAPAKAPPPALTQIDVAGRVRITSANGQTAEGDKAVYKTSTEQITLSGNVVLTQGRQQIRGTRLLIDVKTGVSRILSAPVAESGGRKRMRAVFYPSDLEEMRKQQKTQRRKPKAQPAPRKPPGNATSGWSSTTRGVN
ncbi:MAG: LPS export ABC transporter periplasmic protein LptC, partial [Pseudomonadota bacterium]